MVKALKIILIIAILAGGGFFVYQQVNKPDTTNQDLEAMKQSIIADPNINAPQLTFDQKNKFLGEFKKARDEVIKNNFDFLQAINDVARLKKVLGDFAGAETAWKYANIIRPKNSLSFSNLAVLYKDELQQYDKAEENFLISLENEPGDIPVIRNFYELYHYNMKDDGKAEALLMRSIQQNPETVDLYALTGSFYEETGNKAKAIEYYEKALNITPNNQAIRNKIEKLKSGQ